MISYHEFNNVDFALNEVSISPIFQGGLNSGQLIHEAGGDIINFGSVFMQDILRLSHNEAFNTDTGFFNQLITDLEFKSTILGTGAFVTGAGSGAVLAKEVATGGLKRNPLGLAAAGTLIAESELTKLTITDIRAVKDEKLFRGGRHGIVLVTSKFHSVLESRPYTIIDVHDAINLVHLGTIHFH